jgi:hypothetical protein
MRMERRELAVCSDSDDMEGRGEMIKASINLFPCESGGIVSARRFDMGRDGNLYGVAAHAGSSVHLDGGLPRMSTSWARIIVNVMIEPSASSARPIGSFVVVNPRPCTQEAEEDVPRWSDYNSHMPAPHHQIAGLRSHDSLKPFDSNIEIGRTRVGVSEASPFVDSMN